MLEIPAKGDQPHIKLYENLDELAEHTGQRVQHGYFDAQNRMIVATLDSVAHEIGHYKDFQSGKLKSLRGISDPSERVQATLRNEIVAILFARTKMGPQAKFLEHEIALQEWLQFMRAQNKFGPHGGTALDDLSFAQIQDFAEWVVKLEHPWFQRLEYIFRHYLQEDHMPVTYGYRAG